MASLRGVFVASLIDVVIVNWNAGDRLRECIDSMLDHDGDVIARVDVVDNASTDDSLRGIEDLPGVKVIQTGANLGFAAACNIGASEGGSPYILFLNPDTAVESGSLLVPLSFMEQPENTNIGICGIQLIDEEGEVSRTSARFPTLWRLTVSALGLDRFPGMRGGGVHMRDWRHHESCQVDHVIGAFYLMRRKVFDGLGGFDVQFFVYLEDLDLSFRTKLAGYDSWYLTEARAFHAGGGTSRQVKAHRLFFSLRSKLLYGFKHFPRWQAWCLVGVTGLVEPVMRTAWCLFRGDAAGVRHTWSAYRMLWLGMGRIVRGEGRFEP